MVRGTLYIVAAPSGAGKTSLVRALLQRLDRVRVSVSYTTRGPRPGEQDGVDYHFINGKKFAEMVESKAFLEHATVFDRSYGTGRTWVEQQLVAGTDVILEIDWQGARQVRALFPAAVGIFVLPPTRDELERRLRARGQDGDDVIARRMRDAVAEMSHFKEFEYVIVNKDFDHALVEMAAVIVAHRVRRENINVGILAKDLLSEPIAGTSDV